MVVTQNTYDKSVPFKQHQKAMSSLEKRLAKANAELAKLKGKDEKDRQKAQDRLDSERKRVQAKLDRQKKKNQDDIVKRAAKFEAERVRETRKREQEEAAKWEREIQREVKRRVNVRDSQHWKGWKPLGRTRNKLKTQLTKIFRRLDEVKSLEKAYKEFQSRQDKIYNPATKRWVRKDGKVGRSIEDGARESWDVEARAEEELRQWDQEIREEE